MAKKKKEKNFLIPFIVGLTIITIVVLYLVFRYNGPAPLSQTGIMTDKFSSCGQINLKDGKGVHAPYICDAGNGLIIDGKLKVFTGGGYLPSKREKTYHSGDFDKARVGDTVRVDYELDESGYAKTTCSKCGVTIIRQANLPEETLK